jgi:hypothetical protein
MLGSLASPVMLRRVADQHEACAAWMAGAGALACPRRGGGAARPRRRRGGAAGRGARGGIRRGWGRLMSAREPRAKTVDAVATMPDGGEGVCAALIGNTMYPLVGADIDRVKSIWRSWRERRPAEILQTRRPPRDGLPRRGRVGAMVRDLRAGDLGVDRRISGRAW